MLFNSYLFIFVFLPVTLLGFFLLRRYWRGEADIMWLVVMSLLFYGYWNFRYLALIVASMLANYVLGRLLTRTSRQGRRRLSAQVLFVGVALNLGVLAYFKYANFFVDNMNLLFGSSYSLGVIVLPLAISFFTFQQITYLVDAWKGITREYQFLHYALFVSFFPQLIAGPIVHHKEIIPQFMQRAQSAFASRDLVVGLGIFFLGLFKKAVLADGIAVYATPVFDAAGSGETLTFFTAWSGALAYTMQLYFDFSGYSDMAIGAARMFGIKLPLNFDSPYKAVNIIEFWRRWHMTLSRFLRDYLYIPLGGSRHGFTRRYTNLFITMLLGGLWHGAGWTFVLWGGLHGAYLCVNHAWRTVFARSSWLAGRFTRAKNVVSWSVTFLAVVVGWVFFRAADMQTAVAVLRGMAGVNGVAIPNAIGVHVEFLRNLGVQFYLGGGAEFVFGYVWIALLTLGALLLPNTQELMARFEPALDTYTSNRRAMLWCSNRLESLLVWRPSIAWALLMSAITVTGVMALSQVSEFLYFQF